MTERYRKVFKKHDSNDDGFIAFEEFKAAVQQIRDVGCHGTDLITGQIGRLSGVQQL